MKLLTATFVAALVLSASAWAQTGSPLPNDPGAVVLGTFTVSTNNNLVTSSGTNIAGKPRAKVSQKPNGDVIAELTFMRNSVGKIVYMINTPSIRIVTAGDDMTTASIYNALATAAVAKGTDLEITGCASSASSVVTTVWANSCVTRTGSGAETRFAVANPNLVSSRDFNVLCETAGPWVTMTGVTDPGCTGGSGIQ